MKPMKISLKSRIIGGWVSKKYAFLRWWAVVKTVIKVYNAIIARKSYTKVNDLLFPHYKAEVTIASMYVDLYNNSTIISISESFDGKTGNFEVKFERKVS